MKIRRRNPRAEFARLLPELARMKSERADLPEIYQARIDARLREYTGCKPEGLQRAVSKLAQWEVDEVRRPIVDEFNRRREETRIEISALDSHLEKLADAVGPRGGSTWFPYRERVYSSSYSSQGYSAARYAKGSCLVTAHLLGLEGWRARVVDVPMGLGYDGKPSKVEAFQVEVQLSEPIDVEILKRTFAYSLKDWIKATLKQGLNVRVFSPFLPWGIEEKLGLDHFGNERPAKVAG